MVEEKRGRMVVNAKELPDDVYKILNEKALKRSLTPFIIELVKQNMKTDILLEKLNKIESKIDSITYNDAVIKENCIEKIDEQNEELQEGIIVKNVNEVISEIDELDEIDGDF
ncbi:hypothetical protein KPL35_15850 [Clostridium sp. CF011]|nr:hypothetical protein [Clostridium sp. CF011]MBU3093532.1 hypothetical protein [Clostridium sp. CF011]